MQSCARPVDSTTASLPADSFLIAERIFLAWWCHFDTVCLMAMTLRLTDEEQAALQARAKTEGISMQEAARRAVREYVTRAEHRDHVDLAAGKVLDRHADAIERLGR